MLCIAAVCRHRYRPDIQYNRPQQSEPNTGCEQFDQSESIVDFEHDPIDE